VVTPGNGGGPIEPESGDGSERERDRVAVVLAGGVGTRLYPASSPARPKQFLALDGERPLIERAVDRGRACADHVYVLTVERYADRAVDLADGVLVEPEPKDTGPALAYAAATVRERHPGATMLALPSDHHVGEGFAAVADRALDVAARTGRLVTLGVEPTRAATEYGYIKPGTERDGYCEVERFREKPDPGAAARYREHGYLWNAGVFAWHPEAFLDAARGGPLAPLVEAAERGEPAAGYAAVDPISVDYAVLERTARVAVVPADVEWDDLGSWDAIGRVRDNDDDGNAILGEALTLDAEDCVVAAGEDHHVSVVGVEGLTVAASDGRVLVCPTRDAQRVREVVDRLREEGTDGGEPD
jgi:mannose-1-phosphate guanylyltransferase